MRYVQTCAIADVDALVAVVGLPHSKAIEISRDVICRPGVQVPGGVDIDVVAGMRKLCGGLVVVGVIVAVEAPHGGVTSFVADLAHLACASWLVLSAGLTLSTVAAARGRCSTATTTASAPAATPTMSTASSVVLASLLTITTPSEVGSVVSGAELDLGVVLLMTLLEGEEVGVDLVQRDVVGARGEGGDERVVVRPKSREDVGDGLLLAQWLADGSQSVSQALHVAEVVSRCGALLLGGGELGADLDDPSLGAGGEHALQHKPRITCSGGSHDGGENLLGDGGEEPAQDRLVTDVPGGVLRIGDLGRDRIGALAGGLLDVDRRSLNGPIYMGKEVRVATKVGDHLRAPKHVVAMAESHGDRGGDGHRESGGGSRSGGRHLSMWL